MSKILLANANSLHIPLADKSVHCIVTSPPYFGLRKYEAGDEQLGAEALHDCLAWARSEPPCGRCFVCRLRAVFAELWRVLRDDGTAWLNLGDSYATGTTASRQPSTGVLAHHTAQDIARIGTPPGLQTGDLIGVPWRVALALQADGWILRSDVIWAKRSAMPESVNGWRWERHQVRVESQPRDNGYKGQAHERPHNATDGKNFLPPSGMVDCPGCEACAANGGYVLRRGSWRPTSAHEYIFQLVKGMGYYSDREAVKTKNVRDWRKGAVTWTEGRAKQQQRGDSYHPYKNAKPFENYSHGANLRDVWRLKQTNYSGSHYAVFPESLPETCIKASTSERGVCPVCGAPWARVVEHNTSTPGQAPGYNRDSGSRNDGDRAGRWIDASTTTLSFRRTCEHEAEPVPAVVLDPFAGSGTTCMVAERLGRRSVGLDLSEKYLKENARQRTGLAARDAWVNGKPKQAKTNLDDLPLFGGTK